MVVEQSESGQVLTGFFTLIGAQLPENTQRFCRERGSPLGINEVGQKKEDNDPHGNPDNF